MKDDTVSLCHDVITVHSIDLLPRHWLFHMSCYRYEETVRYLHDEVDLELSGDGFACRFFSDVRPDIEHPTYKKKIRLSVKENQEYLT